jgi:hypothetical protein
VIVLNRDRIRTVAALHQQEGALRVVVGRLEGSGGSGGTGPVRVLAAETIYPTSGPAALTGLAERVGGVDLVVRVLPPGLTVARVVALPISTDGEELDGEATADALALIAETDLPSAIPAYRRAAGLINPGRGDGNRAVGLLTAWPSAAELDGSKTPRIAREVCISESAALAVLANALGGVDRAWTIDRQGGAMTILAAGEKTVVRVARVPAGEIGAEVRRTAIAEASKAAGLDALGAPGVDDGLSLEPAPESVRLLGESRSREWIGQFGLAGAAIMAFADASPAISGLVGLHETEPKAKPAIVQRVSEWAGAPSRVVAICAACVLLAVGVAVAVPMGRVKVLERQVTDKNALFAENNKDEADLRFARALKERRWPMTKLLADISGACPVGVTLDSIELAPGEPIMIRGLAPDTDKLSSFRSNLDQTKVFSDIATPQNSPGDKGVQFQITAKIAAGAALMVAKPAEDFVATPLSVRMYGESARGSGGVTTAKSGGRPERTDRPSRDRRNSNNNNNNGSSTTPNRSNSRDTTRDTSRDSGSRNDRNDRTSSTPAKPAPIPPPLTDAEVAKMTQDQAMLEWSKRKSLSKQAGLDQATKDRLMADSEKANARFQELKNKGGGQ